MHEEWRKEPEWGSSFCPPWMKYGRFSVLLVDETYACERQVPPPMSKKNNQNGSQATPLIIVIVLALVLAACAYLCRLGGEYIAGYRDNALDIAQMEATERNQKLADEYARQKAEYQQKLNERAGANAAWPLPNSSGWDVVDLTNYPLENAQLVSMTRQDAMYNGMLLVNEWHSLPEDFRDDGMVSFYAYSKQLGISMGVRDAKIRLLPAAAQAFYNMLADAKEKQNYEHYVMQDAYRSWEEQNTLFEAQKVKYESRYSGNELIERTKKDVNYPGTSSYQSGSTAQLILYEYKNAEVNNKVFFESPEGLWVYENAWRYGIVFRFPVADYPMQGTTDKSYKTGVSKKLQTFAYVGKGNAIAMNLLDLCMEEYIEYLMEHPHIALFENGQLRYEINRQYVGDDESFQVQVVGNGNVLNTTTSLDNMGYVINVFEYSSPSDDPLK